MLASRSFFRTCRRVGSQRPRLRHARARWPALGLAALFSAAAQVVPAQQFADFETGMDGFVVHGNITSNHVVTAGTSSLVSSTGANSLRVSKSPDGFSWTVRVDGHAVSNNVAFYNAVSNALNDPTESYDVAFEIIYVPGDIPGAGTTDTTWLFTLPRMQSDAGAANYANIGLSGSDIENLTSTRVQNVRIPLDFFNLSPTSPYYILYLSLNGDWGTGTAAVYYDNFRVEVTPVVPTTGVVFDFNDGLDGWVSNSGAEIGLSTNIPTTGEVSLYVSDDFPGKVRHGRVTKYPGDAHPFFDYVRSAVRDDPSRYNLEFDFIVRPVDFPSAPVWVRPWFAWNGDDGFGWVEPDLPSEYQVDLTTITGDTVIPMQVPLDQWFTVYNDPWTPTYIQLQAGAHVSSSLGVYKFYYDNFAIREIPSTLPPSAFITDIDVPGNVTLSWQSHTGSYYSVERATSLNPDWAPIASNLVATPPLNTYAGYAPSGAVEYFRLQTFDQVVLEEPLFSFETGLEGWGLVDTNSPTVIVATNLVATDGTNSLALVRTTTGFHWDTFYALGADDFVTNIPPVWTAISNALTDVSNQWFIAADFTWNGAGIATNPVPTYIKMQVAFNSNTNSMGGWMDYGDVFTLQGSTVIGNLAAGGSSVTKTWGIPIEDTGWSTDITTNSFLQIQWGLHGDWAGGDTMVGHVDNWRLTTVAP